jgi:hypothetical protein
VPIIQGRCDSIWTNDGLLCSSPGDRTRSMECAGPEPGVSHQSSWVTGSLRWVIGDGICHFGIQYDA